MATSKVKAIVKNGTMNLYLTGDIVTVTSTKGVVKKAGDGNYYRDTVTMQEGIPTPTMSDSLGTSV